ncbi:MAG: hypothetical protein QOG46_1251 [Pseudonocardiales bacterium]|nr:hypothetical protein [Pseudonocardiales bacterium]
MGTVRSGSAHTPADLRLVSVRHRSNGSIDAAAPDRALSLQDVKRTTRRQA